ncbi:MULTISPECIES: hypothetical protein [unclassified Parafrankia]|uniref:hypothetical protein n=1 Tax=unclassified Parafrankia TaxID=2994368 RepID=UPI000DA4B798|nr:MULTISPECIES: hypothetical protein [unclassified Parafrankia]TCJ34050.1 hypothetical protein E0504_34665 [Parafrankia sp. BMG5.11]SQD97771.1 hypothetical protein FMEAI12_4290006 [Parafrankia sp. Ea1.12]
MTACASSDPAEEGGTVDVNVNPSAGRAAAGNNGAQQNTPAGSGTPADRDTPAVSGSPAVAGKPGTRQDPLPVGTSARIGDWDVKLGRTIQNATDQVLAANTFNKPPVAGRQYVMVPLEATYRGPDEGTAWAELGFKFVGSKGNIFYLNVDDNCGALPQPLIDAGNVYAGASAQGNICKSVPSDQVAGGTWIVFAVDGPDDSETFFRVS